MRNIIILIILALISCNQKRTDKTEIKRPKITRSKFFPWGEQRGEEFMLEEIEKLEGRIKSITRIHHNTFNEGFTYKEKIILDSLGRIIEHQYEDYENMMENNKPIKIRERLIYDEFGNLEQLLNYQSDTLKDKIITIYEDTLAILIYYLDSEDKMKVRKSIKYNKEAQIILEEQIDNDGEFIITQNHYYKSGEISRERKIGSQSYMNVILNYNKNGEVIYRRNEKYDIEIGRPVTSKMRDELEKYDNSSKNSLKKEKPINNNLKKSDEVKITQISKKVKRFESYVELEKGKRVKKTVEEIYDENGNCINRKRFYDDKFRDSKKLLIEYYD